MDVLTNVYTIKMRKIIKFINSNKLLFYKKNFFKSSFWKKNF